MGLPVERFIVGSNKNDILTRFLATGAMSIEGVEPSYAPSMDIQVSSNFERLLFDLLGRDGARVTEVMQGFRASGSFTLERDAWERAAALFSGHRLDDEETLAEIGALHRSTGELIDPHSAIGVAAARARAQGLEGPVVALGTAHPAKFPDAVEKATGLRPALPERLGDLMERPEYAVDVEAGLDHIERLIDDSQAMSLQNG
jgi:threonine synthase